jgi:hypothetical protein
MNCCLLAYSFEATECPSIRQTTSAANTSVMAPVPLCQDSKAWRMIFRLASVGAAPGLRHLVPPVEVDGAGPGLSVRAAQPMILHWCCAWCS